VCVCVYDLRSLTEVVIVASPNMLPHARPVEGLAVCVCVCVCMLLIYLMAKSADIHTPTQLV
jgi:hypothetical protein